jgi:hypothetical protein
MEAVVAYSKVLFPVCLKGLRRTAKPLNEDNGCYGGIVQETIEA